MLSRSQAFLSVFLLLDGPSKCQSSMVICSWSARAWRKVTEECSREYFWGVFSSCFDKRAISHLLQCGVDYMKPCRPTYGVAHVLKRQMPSLTSSRFWSPLLEQLNEVCLVLTDGSFLCPPAHQCPPRQTNHRCFAKTKWPPSVRAQWHLHLLSDKPLKVQGKISALSVHIKSLISLHQHSLPVLHSRDRLNLKTDSHTEHFDFITTRHWIFIYFFLTAVSSHTWNQQGVIHYSLVEGNGVWSNRVYWGADKPGLHFLIH